jgi:uracil-DNA glycosylase family 4
MLHCGARREKAMNGDSVRRRIELERMMGVDVLVRSRVRPPAAQHRGDVSGTARELAEIEAQVKQCTKCRLREKRTQGVFARGRCDAELMFIGEGPGADEDRIGLPFVGRAGKLLDKMIAAMGLGRDDVYITNIVKCRPPENREPRPDEITACRPYLERQIELIRPKFICTLGRPASNSLLGVEMAMNELRGRWFYYKDIPVLPTYHPAYLLRSPGQKRVAWEDMKKLILALHGIKPPA